MGNTKINFKFDHSKSTLYEAVGLSKDQLDKVLDKVEMTVGGKSRSTAVELLQENFSKEEVILALVCDLKASQM